MKQSGVRLVQRKFAQGVPLPTSTAPLPPERKAEPGNPPKNVFHNHMSAKSLLDLVSIKNIHKHKQEPLVVLERLRDHEIPTPPVAKPRARARTKTKRGTNKNMCLRSGKQKSPDAKGAAKRRKKQSSESTDDVPLLYYFNRSTTETQSAGGKEDERKEDTETNETSCPKGRGKRRRASSSPGKPDATSKKNPVKTEDGASFKEPSGPARISSRLEKSGRKLPEAGATNKKTRPQRRAKLPRLASAMLPGPSNNRASPTLPGPSNNSLSPTLPGPSTNSASPKPSRAGSHHACVGEGAGAGARGVSEPAGAGARGVSEPAGAGARGVSEPAGAGARGVSEPAAAATRLYADHVVKDELVIGPVLVQPRPELCAATAKQPRSASPTLPGPSNNSWSPTLPGPSTNSGSPKPSRGGSLRSDRDSMDSIASFLAAADFDTRPQASPSCGLSLEAIRFANAPTPLLEEIGLQVLQATPQPSPQPASQPPLETYPKTPSPSPATLVTMPRPKVIKREEVTESAQTNENTTPDERKPATKKNQSAEAPKKNQSAEAPKNTKPKRGAKPVPEEAPKSTRLLRNSREPPAPNPDVYDFDNEIEATRPPSSLRRGIATPPPRPDQSVNSATPASCESVEYVDILPTSSHCVQPVAQITPTTKEQESGTDCPRVSLVPKEEVGVTTKKNLIENLSNSPALLNKFFDCLTVEMRNELDNLITAEGLNQPSTSKEETGYLDQKAGSVFEAPTFYPTAEQFQDPIKYYDKIAPQASKYGLCKIVPPEGFSPPCNMSETIRFAVIYQYISKMYNRWGPNSRELAAIKAHLRTQSVVFARSPLLDGSEVNLPKLYHAVERNGGLSAVMQRKRWSRVAEEMKLSKLQHPERKLDPLYMRYLLPYAALSDQERQNTMTEVEKCWTKKYQKMLERARNPFQRQNRMLSGNESEESSADEGEDGNTAGALHEAEDCIVQGRVMNLATFKKIATSLMEAHFDAGSQPPSATDVEKAYWRAVLLGTEHIVANTASIDTGEEGYGFPKDPEATYGRHPWNLKALALNPNNVLRYLGDVLGVTVPTLHLSMLFSTSCWHRDPHGLPWMEYMHSGAQKVWYGIPRTESANFRRAVETLCPAYCQNKSIWLASEITMIPPNILSEHGVKLCRLQQSPGEYVMVFPEAHSCSITTGFGISESVYFASKAWLSEVYKLFQELRNSCEPSMFSLEQLLMNGSADSDAPPQVCSVLCTLLAAELEHRRALERKGLKIKVPSPSSAPVNTYFSTWNTRDQDECEYCRCTLFLSKVTGLTCDQSAVCPEHALSLLEAKKYRHADMSALAEGGLKFISSFSTNELEELIERLDCSAEEVSRSPSVIDLTVPDVKADLDTSTD